jgi:hypothetical protein
MAIAVLVLVARHLVLALLALPGRLALALAGVGAIDDLGGQNAAVLARRARAPAALAEPRAFQAHAVALHLVDTVRKCRQRARSGVDLARSGVDLGRNSNQGDGFAGSQYVRDDIARGLHLHLPGDFGEVARLCAVV